MTGAVLGVDPGTRKCGFAVVTGPQRTPLELGIVATADLPAKVVELAERFPIRAIALGGGTHTLPVAELLAGVTIPVAVIDERETTLLARQRYFAAHPPRGWRRFVPRGMLVPPGPIDDFAAILIAERLFDREAAG